MIDDYQVTLSSDLWALGVILFKMVTGKMPFKAGTARGVYAETLTKKIDWPVDDPVDINAVHLIESLMQVIPDLRMGAPNTPNDMKILYAHPFFSGIDFSLPLHLQFNIENLLE